MRCIKIVLAFIFLFPLATAAQAAIGYSSNNSDTLPAIFKLDVKKLRAHIYSGVPAHLKNGVFKRKIFRFADESAQRIAHLISGGEVYSNWMSLENYLNEILRKVIPAELKNDSVIHVYVLQDGSYNAFMTPSGHLFINIGIFAEVPDEATIAGVIAHELAHYYLKHSLYTFIEREEGLFDQGVFFKNKTESRYSIKRELQADSLSLIWLHQSGYNIGGLIYSFEILNRLEKNLLRKLEKKWTLEETTHPLSDKRLNQLDVYHNQYKDKPGNSFLVDESKFNLFREEAKPEMLRLLLDDFEFYECIERSFRFHIFDPDNVIFVYYLMESIRRNCYLNAELWNKMFITDRYYEQVVVNDRRHKEAMRDHLFKSFDLEILPIAPQEGVKIKAKFYWRDKPRFTTYEEAFNFFYTVSQRLNCHECVLSTALSFTKDHQTRNKYLDAYIQHDDSRHKAFAKNLMEGTITRNLKNSKLVVIDNFDVIIRQGNEDIPVHMKPPARSILNIIDTVISSQQKRKAVFMDTFKNSSIKTYRRLLELEKFSFMLTVSKGEKTELYILNPEYWELFHEHDVNEIEFINTQLYEFRGKEKSLEAYKNIVDEEFNTLLLTARSDRECYVYITSVRVIQGGVMKIRYHDEAHKITSNENMERKLTAILKYELNRKERAAAELDNRYRNNLGE